MSRQSMLADRSNQSPVQPVAYPTGLRSTYTCAAYTSFFQDNVLV
jgi:hypothetical protein